MSVAAFRATMTSDGMRGTENLPLPEPLDVVDGIGRFHPRGRCTLVEAVDLISSAIGWCRASSVGRLLVNGTGLEGMSVPSLVDRFLMVEEWAQVGSGLVVVALVVDAKYIHPEKVGVKIAADFGLICDVCDTEPDALEWLCSVATPSQPPT